MLWLLSGSSSRAQLQTVVVLPFANQSKNAGLLWMSESFAEVLEDRHTLTKSRTGHHIGFAIPIQITECNESSVAKADAEKKTIRLRG